MNAELWQKYTEAVAAERAAKARLDAALTAKAEAMMAHLVADSELSTARLALLRQPGGEHAAPMADVLKWNEANWPPQVVEPGGAHAVSVSDALGEKP